MDSLKKGALFFMFFMLLNSVSSLDLLFNEAGTSYVNLTIPYSSLSDLTYTITGSEYNGSFPSNISIDIVNDNIIDWEYIVYNSNETLNFTHVNNAWSADPDDSELYFVNMSAGNIIDMVSFGSVITNIFDQDNILSKGILGITTIGGSSGGLSSQIVTIYSNNSITHAFVPNIEFIFASPGFYVAKGGSTYYCNSANAEPFDPVCDLSPQQAMVAGHLARAADVISFSQTETVRNPNTINSINANITNCILSSCNVTIKVTTATAGNISLADFNFTSIPAVLPANITLAENSTSYIVNIIPHANITRTAYFYGTKPNVYIIQVKAQDENRSLTLNQTNRINKIAQNISQSWDNLTNSSHPLKFYFYNQTFVLENFSMNSTSTEFNDALWNSLIPNLFMQDPAILVVLDIYDYLNDSSSNTKRSGEEYSIISNIYINGFRSAQKTALTGYDDQILMNVLLHELAHTFVDYPGTQEKLFYSNHPASFSSVADFDTFPISDSPTGRQGYFEIYSVLNQLRPYMLNSQFQNRLVELSSLDKMLMGILSPDLDRDFSFYEGNISKSGNQFLATTFSQTYSKYAGALYYNSEDEIWWDVRNESEITEKGTNLSFSLSKSAQNQALWIIAQDNYNTKHFQVFNRNSSSSINFITETEKPSIDFGIGTDQHGITKNVNNIYVNVTAMDSSSGLKNITIRLYNSDSLLYVNTSFTSPFTINYTNLPNDMYQFSATAYDFANNANHTETRLITIDVVPDTSAPLIILLNPLNSTYNSAPNSINYTVSDNSLNACWYSLNSGVTNISISCGSNVTGLSALQGTNIWTVYANDTAGNTNSDMVTFTVDSINPLISYGAGTENNASALNRNNIVINVTASDSTAGLKNITIRLYNSTSLLYSNVSSSSSLRVNYTSLSYGLYYFNATAYDFANNFNKTETRIINITVDSIPPQVTINSPTSTTYTSLPIIFNVSLNKNGSVSYSLNNGINNYTMSSTNNRNFNATNSTIPDGSYTLRVYAVDTFGNFNRTSSTTFTIDTSVPAETGGNGGGGGGGGGGGNGNSATNTTKNNTTNSQNKTNHNNINQTKNNDTNSSQNSTRGNSGKKSAISAFAVFGDDESGAGAGIKIGLIISIIAILYFVINIINKDKKIRSKVLVSTESKDIKVH